MEQSYQGGVKFFQTRQKTNGRMHPRVTVVTEVIKNPVDSTAGYFFATAHYGDSQ